MAEMAWDGREVSFTALVAILIRSWRRIALWTLLGGVVLATVAFLKPAKYPASASFVPQGSEASRTGLAGLAGQLGVTIDNSQQALSPEFYRRLLQSRVLLDPIARDTFVVAELGRRVAYLDLFKIPKGPPERRKELGVAMLRSITAVGIEKSTGVVQLVVTTRWPSVSLAIATALVNGVSNYNEHIRQTQAAAERKFIEGRLSLASSDLRSAEDRLADFLRTNRQYGGSAELAFQKERLQREVSLKQDVFTSMTQAYEDARVREVRDTPVITIFEPPEVSSLPEARHRLQSLVFGLLLGFICGTLATFASVIIRQTREESETEDVIPAPVPERKRSSLAQRKWLGENAT